jgi:hypothetical protein
VTLGAFGKIQGLKVGFQPFVTLAGCRKVRKGGTHFSRGGRIGSGFKQEAGDRVIYCH